jgi:hypothetical protein
MRFLFPLFLLLLPAFSAQAAAHFTCTPDTFTLTREAGGWRLAGTLETPTAGYRYVVSEPTSQRREILQAPLTLVAPDGMAATMIDSIHINERIDGGGELLRLTLSIRKPFNWGPDVIDCAVMKETAK